MPDDPIKPAVVDEKTAAFYIGMSTAFLRQSRVSGNLEGRTKAPPFLRLGRSIRYLISDLDAWLLENRVELG